MRAGRPLATQSVEIRLLIWRLSRRLHGHAVARACPQTVVVFGRWQRDQVTGVRAATGPPIHSKRAAISHFASRGFCDSSPLIHWKPGGGGGVVLVVGL